MAKPKASREQRLATKRAWYAANRERVRAAKKASRARTREQREDYKRRWNAANPEKVKAMCRKANRKRRIENPLKVVYATQKTQAKNRGIVFLLTFDEWLTIWRDSGRLSERGLGGTKYCMARHGDVGPYAIGNVRICTNRENRREQRRIVSKATCSKLSEALKAYYRRKSK